jgi:hypothetical protein
MAVPAMAVPARASGSVRPVERRQPGAIPIVAQPSLSVRIGCSAGKAVMSFWSWMDVAPPQHTFGSAGAVWRAFPPSMRSPEHRMPPPRAQKRQALPATSDLELLYADADQLPIRHPHGLRAGCPLPPPARDRGRRACRQSPDSGSPPGSVPSTDRPSPNYPYSHAAPLLRAHDTGTRPRVLKR